MDLAPEVVDLIRRTADGFPWGPLRRRYMADTLDSLGLGQRQAQTLFGWGRDTIRKAQNERRSGLTCADATSRRGSKPAEFHLPRLLDDITEIVKDHVQTDPTFQTRKLYCRISAPEVRRQLIWGKGYSDEQLPSRQTIGTKLNALGFHLTKVAKSRPKKVKETDAIFEELARVHQEAEQSDDTVRASYDAKATVKVGPFSRGGYSRTGAAACDHDFKATANLTPAGIFLPGESELDLYFSDSKVTSDFIADLIEDWWGHNRGRFAGKKKLLLNLDNGPENQSRRSQFLLRMIQLAQKEQITIHLAYYPPYHSKYNPIERCWGILENYWRGELLDSEESVLGYARQMTYNGKHPRVQRTTKPYKTGVRLSRKGLEQLEAFVQRKPGLEKWFVVIPPPSPHLFIQPD